MGTILFIAMWIGVIFIIIILAIKKSTEEVLHDSKRDITIELNLEEMGADKKNAN
jgi:hypothetical protein